MGGEEAGGEEERKPDCLASGPRREARLDMDCSWTWTLVEWARLGYGLDLDPNSCEAHVESKSGRDVDGMEYSGLVNHATRTFLPARGISASHAASLPGESHGRRFRLSFPSHHNACSARKRVSAFLHPPCVAGRSGAGSSPSAIEGTEGRKCTAPQWRWPRSCAGGRSRRRAAMVSARFHLCPVNSCLDVLYCTPVRASVRGPWCFVSCCVCRARTCAARCVFGGMPNTRRVV